ncbi:MAG: hypothetical protein Q9200_004560 [Gallowayella weberi]
MPRLFGRKFICFYCNRRSAQDRKAGVRQWQCEQCEAVNHLDDQHGEITDPPVPAQQTPIPTRYVQPLPRSHSPVSNLNDRSLFCSRCLQNQHIVSQALAEYLPSQDDPNYPDFERALPAYRKKMEERFPQVCGECAPAVEDRIWSTGYAAKTDHLRRLMDRTRGKDVTRKRWDFKNTVVFLAGCGWLVALTAYLYCHILGSFPTTEVKDGFVDHHNPKSFLMYFLIDLPVRPPYNGLVKSILAHRLTLSLICFWWNPRMNYKLRGGFGRVVGRTDYYQLQLVTLAVRFVTWKLGAKEPILPLDPQTNRAVHAFGVVLEIMLAVLSFRTLRIDQRPQVFCQEQYVPLIPNRPKTEDVSALPRHPSDLSTPLRPRVERFPMEKLAPNPLVQQQPPYHPPTPPPEDDAENMSMDWTPQHNFRPATAYNNLQAPSTFNEPSPFHGALPPAPVSWAQRLRNPPQPAFHKASEEKKAHFFGKKNGRMLSDDASDVSSSFSPKSLGFMSEISSPVKFAPPRFFAPTDHMETGLESLFEETFSLGKDAKPFDHQAEQENVKLGMSSLASSPWPRFMTALLLSASCGAWENAAAFFPSSALVLRTMCQAIAATVSSLNAASSAALPRTIRSTGSALFYGVEAAVAVGFGTLIWRPLGYGAFFDFSNLGLWFLVALTVQEIWDFVSCLFIPAPSMRVELEDARKTTEQGTVSQQEALQQSAPKSAARKRPVKQGPKVDKATGVAANANINTMQLSQRMTRSRAHNESRRDSLGVDGLGNLSLGGW